MDIENNQIINSAEADAAVDSTYVVVSIILIFLFGLGLCALEHCRQRAPIENVWSTSGIF